MTKNINMGYYCYHKIAQNLIKNGHLINYKIVESHNNICPALILEFDNHKLMPIRKEKWQFYFDFIDKFANINKDKNTKEE